MTETSKKVLDSVSSKALRAMKVGDSLTVDVARLGSVRSQCYMYSLQWDRKYTTATDRKARVVTITRTA